MPASKVAVIGAGIVGTLCAFLLQRDGHAVTLYERGAPGREASFGNSGIFSPGAVVPIAMPGVLARVPRWLFAPTGPLYLRWDQLPRLLPWLLRFARSGREAEVRRISAALRGLNAPTLDLLLPLLADTGLERLIDRRGLLYVFRSEAEWRAERLALELRRGAGRPVETLSARELAALDPHLAAGLARGIHLPDAAHCRNPHRLVTGLVERFAARGGRLVRADIASVRPRRDRGVAVAAAAGSEEFDLAVVAAGVWSRRLVAPLGYRVPLVSERGYHAMVAAPAIVPRMPVISVGHMATVVPMEMGVRVAGTVEFAGPERPADPARGVALLRAARATFPELGGRPDGYWMGHRPSTPDSLPVLGRAPRHPALLFAFGHGHQGMIGAPRTAQVIADLAAGRAPPIDLASFAVDRFRSRLNAAWPDPPKSPPPAACRG